MKILYETDSDIWFQSEGAWEVNLDQRKLKTPLGNPLKVSITLDKLTKFGGCNHTIARIIMKVNTTCGSSCVGDIDWIYVG